MCKFDKEVTKNELEKRIDNKSNLSSACDCMS